MCVNINFIVSPTISSQIYVTKLSGYLINNFIMCIMGIMNVILSNKLV